MVNEFKVGDEVAHTGCGNGTVIPGGMDIFGMYHVNVELENGDKRMCLPVNLRPRNFLSKIAEEQEGIDPAKALRGIGRLLGDDVKNLDVLIQQDKTVGQQFNEVFKDAMAHGTGVMKDGKHVPHSEVFNTDRFQRNAYGQLVDTVTGLPADSEGIVSISSIKATVRSMG